jgi:segregation and condensation protein B
MLGLSHRRESVELSVDQIKRVVEASLLMNREPTPAKKIAELFTPEENINERAIIDVITLLIEDYRGRGIELVEVASGYRFQVCADLAPWIQRTMTEKPQRYSRALLETLALIAYRQPITRAEIEEIRGVVVSTQIMRTLEEREWVRVIGHRDVPGRPALYATTKQFLNDLNLKSLGELPTLAELQDLDKIDGEFQQLNLDITNSQDGTAQQEPQEATSSAAETTDAAAINPSESEEDQHKELMGEDHLAERQSEAGDHDLTDAAESEELIITDFLSEEDEDDEDEEDEEIKNESNQEDSDENINELTDDDLLSDDEEEEDEKVLTSEDLLSLRDNEDEDEGEDEDDEDENDIRSESSEEGDSEELTSEDLLSLRDDEDESEDVDDIRSESTEESDNEELTNQDLLSENADEDEEIDDDAMDEDHQEIVSEAFIIEESEEAISIEVMESEEEDAQTLYENLFAEVEQSEDSVSELADQEAEEHEINHEATPKMHEHEFRKHHHPETELDESDSDLELTETESA